MPLRETAAKIPQKRSGFSCGVEKVSAKLDQADREWLTEQLTSDVTAQWISDVLRDEGHDVSQGVVARHRAGRCRCETV